MSDYNKIKGYAFKSKSLKQMEALVERAYRRGDIRLLYSVCNFYAQIISEQDDVILRGEYDKLK